jgi:hypothetical protein
MPCKRAHCHIDQTVVRPLFPPNAPIIGNSNGQNSHQHFRLALPRLARRLLSSGFAATPRAGIRFSCLADDRDQWFVLSAAATNDARRISDQPPAALNSRYVYCYFDNDIKVKAPFDAKRLIDKLGL